MNRLYIFRFLLVLFVLCSSFAAGARAQGPEAAPPLPAGMTGSDTSDPRAKLAAFVRVYVVRHCRLRVEALVANREIGWLDAERVTDIRRSRRAIRDILVGVLVQGVEKGVFDPPQVDGRRDLKALAMALLDQCTHISMWYGPGGRLGEEQMSRLYAEIALRSAGAKPSGS